MKEATTPFGLYDDELWPRTEEFRYRIYGRVGRELKVLAVATDPGGVGMALVQIHADQKSRGRRLADLGQIGVLDVIGDGPGLGDWIVLPWSRNYSGAPEV